MRLNTSREWLERMAALEDGCCVTAISPELLALVERKPMPYCVIEKSDFWVLHDPAHAPHGRLYIPRDGRWAFNGDYANPTFSPSINESWGNDEVGYHRNHYFVRNGRVEYCGDSTHALAGQAVDLPPLTEAEMAMYWPERESA